MPTISLYDTPADPDAYHRVRAPGGYEWWHFEATCAADGGRRMAIDFFDGDPFNPAYVAAYANYRRRPTRVAPPVPRDYPCVRVETFAGCRQAFHANDPCPPGKFYASEDGREICICGSTFRREDGGVLRVSLERVELTFTPVELHPARVTELPGDERGVVHYRIVSASSYEVTGALCEGAIAGRGTYVHYMGTGPIGRTKVY